jgi:hypothetical protein
MKTKKRFHQTASGKEAAVTNNEVFAKQKLQRTKLTWKSILFAVAIVILTLTVTACGDSAGETPTARSAGTEKALTFGTNCKVTIKSDDKFTNAEWTAACDKVVAMIKRGYDAATTGGKTSITAEFAAGNTMKVILVNNLAYNWESKASEPGVLYVKTTSIDSVNGTAVVDAMLDGTTSNG